VTLLFEVAVGLSWQSGWKKTRASITSCASRFFSPAVLSMVGSGWWFRFSV